MLSPRCSWQELSTGIHRVDDVTGVIHTDLDQGTRPGRPDEQHEMPAGVVDKFKLGKPVTLGMLNIVIGNPMTASTSLDHTVKIT